MTLGGQWDRFGTWCWRILAIPLMIFCLVQIGEGLATGVVTIPSGDTAIAYTERPISYWGALVMWLIPAAAAPGFFYYSWFRAPDE